MVVKTSNADLDATAAAWAARVDRGQLSEDEQRQLDEWLAADRRCLGAFARARAISAHFDRAKALGKSFDPAKFRRSLGWRPPGFRHWATGAVAATIAAVALSVILLSPGQELMTLRGEVRLVPLSDGSAVTLNTNTTLTVDYSDSHRRIELVEGEALFNVAKDTARPFTVDAGDTLVRAVGTSFIVRRLAGQKVKVVVREGVVELTHAGAPISPVRITANRRAYAEPHKPVETTTVRAPELERELAWQEGMIALDGVTLREAAEEFARYSDIRIIIEDPAVANLTVTGLFSANNPVGFARAAATSMELQADVEPHVVRLHR